MMHIYRPASHEEEKIITIKEHTIFELFDYFKTYYTFLRTVLNV